MEPIDLEREDPPISLSGYANGEIMTLEISDVSPDLLVLEVKDSNLPESIHGSLDMEMNADFHEDDDDDGHGFANVELQFFPCDACEASFTSEPELEQHLISSHSICDVASERGRQKAKSMETERVSPLHTCMTCGKVFKYLTSFRKHEETHIKALYTCKTCGKEFKYLTLFTKHQDTHVVPRTRGRRKGKSIKAVGLSVNKKMKGLHTCKHCGKEFKYVTSFIKHEKTHRITRTKRQRTLSTSKINIRLQGNRKDATETHVRANKKNRKNSEDTNDQDACILISSAEQQTPDTKRSPPFPCLDCGKIFKFFKSYQKHQKRHAWAQGKSEGVPPKQKHGSEAKENIRCPVCGRAFNKQTTRNKHQNIYHLKNNFHKNTNALTCCECDRHFEKADLFQKHKCFHLRKHVKAFIEAGRVSQDGDVFYCQLCVLQLTSGLEFENHARDIHPDQYRKILKAVGNIIKDTLKGLQTRRVDNQLTSQEEPEINLNSVGETEEDGSRQFICKNCGEYFLYRVSFTFCGKCLKDRKDRRKASKVYHCEECGQHFGRKDHLKRHSYSHSGSSFVCSDCGVKFRDPGELRTHEKTHQVRNYACQQCGKRFEQEEELMLHREVAHPEPGGYTCHRCGKTFSTVKNLGKHRMIHSNKTPHVCSNCGTKFKRREHLRRHESLHTNEKPHLCHCCGDTFGRKEDLNTHLGKMHIISRHFLCKACGTSFKDRNALRRHRYHAHTKAGKVFQCEACGLSFGRADHLKRHKHTHSTERPFSCSMCYKVFHRADNLKKHERNHRNKWLEYLNTHRHKTPKQESIFSESSKWKLRRSEASALLKLIQSHSKQQQHICYVCKKTFRGIYYLKRHRLLNCCVQRNKMDSFRYGTVK